MESAAPVALDSLAQEHHARRALSNTRRHLLKTAAKLAAYLVIAYLVLKLIPTLSQALHSLEHVSWAWLLGAIALEVLSELGFVAAWRVIIDPQKVLADEGRGRRTDADVAWVQLGGGLVRLLRSLQPEAALVTPWAHDARPAPHHPLVLGAGISLAGGSPELAARAAALAVCASPASAAVRLLGLDPFAVQAMLARLAPGIDDCARRAAKDAAGPPSSLPAYGAPALDLLADFHLTAEVRLFAS